MTAVGVSGVNAVGCALEVPDEIVVAVDCCGGVGVIGAVGGAIDTDGL